MQMKMLSIGSTTPSTPVPSSGLGHYLGLAKEVALHAQESWPPVLARMIATRLIYKLQATDYCTYGLHRQPFGALSSFVTKAQTTRLFFSVNPAAERWRVDDKLAFHRLCQEAGLSTPEILAVVTKRSDDQHRGFTCLGSLADVLSHIGAVDDVQIFLKPRSDSLGTGTRYLRLRRGVPHDVNNHRIDVQSFGDELDQDLRRDDYLVQPFIRPHPFLAGLGSGPALGTIRVDSFFHRDRLNYIYVLIRIPCGRNIADNFLSGRTGNLIAAVDADSGRIGAAFGRRDPAFPHLAERFESNPDTGRRIEGEQIPHWDQVRDFISRGCRLFSMLPMLGWDIAVTPDGPIAIEANSNPDIFGEQMTSGQGAKGILKPVYQAAGLQP